MRNTSFHHTLRSDDLQLLSEHAAPAEEDGAELNGGGEGDAVVGLAIYGQVFAKFVVDDVENAFVRFEVDLDRFAAEHGKGLFAVFGDVERLRAGSGIDIRIGNFHVLHSVHAISRHGIMVVVIAYQIIVVVGVDEIDGIDDILIAVFAQHALIAIEVEIAE